MVTIPSDPLFRSQWYLLNTGQGGRTPGIDLNVVNIWDEYTGAGVAIAILDDAVERDHEDLRRNFDDSPSSLPDYNYLFEGAPFFIDDNHGTSVAGIIAAANNRVGGVGVAFNASITAFSYNNLTPLDASPLERQAAFDISNNSWGVDNPFQANFALSLYERAGDALTTAVREGRGGLGTVFVWAAGNEFAAGASSNYGSYEGSRFTITVASMDGDGIVAPYSVQGSNLLVSAFGDGDPEFGIPGSIVTTDRTGSAGFNRTGGLGELPDPNYTNQFNGTSASAPMVSGVVALMLEANRRLGYRDVQEILAYTARRTDPIDSGWRVNGAENWNGGGLHTNLDYGFGLVDAHAAVRLAETWQSRSTLFNEAVTGIRSTLDRTIDDAGITNSRLRITSGVNIDHVEIDIDLTHPDIEDLIITLVSPEGTRSVLFNGPGLIDIFLEDGETAPFSDFANDPNAFTSDPELLALGASYDRGIDFTFSSTFNWGETGVGDWTLEIEDTTPGSVGILREWALRLYGDTITGNDTYIYTNEFATFFGGDRALLQDTLGVDTLNAAAVTTGLRLNLTPGGSNLIAGRNLTIASDTLIENAYGGDSRDRIGGNAARNRLSGMRGNDKLLGGDGDDLLLGGVDNDRLKGGNGNDTLRGEDGNDRLIGGNGRDRLLGGDGDDVLDGGDGKDSLKGGRGRDRLLGGGGGIDTLQGGGDRDVFVLQEGDGRSFIQDFRLDQDSLGLSRGIRSGGLDISQAGRNTEISFNTDVLAVLRGVRADDLSRDDFVRA